MEHDKTFTVSYPDGLQVEYRESDLMPGFDESYHAEAASDA